MPAHTRGARRRAARRSRRRTRRRRGRRAPRRFEPDGRVDGEVAGEVEIADELVEEQAPQALVGARVPREQRALHDFGEVRSSANTGRSRFVKYGRSVAASSSRERAPARTAWTRDWYRCGPRACAEDLRGQISRRYAPGRTWIVVRPVSRARWIRRPPAARRDWPGGRSCGRCVDGSGMRHVGAGRQPGPHGAAARAGPARTPGSRPCRRRDGRGARRSSPRRNWPTAITTVVARPVEPGPAVEPDLDARWTRARPAQAVGRGAEDAHVAWRA